jgi:hypothetical protein
MVAAACALPLACRQIIGISEITVDSGADANDFDAPAPPPNPVPPPPPPPIVDAGVDADAEFDAGHTACIQSCVADAGTTTASDYFEGTTDGILVCLCEPTECSSDCKDYCANKANGRDAACTNCAVNDLNDPGSMCFPSRCTTTPCTDMNDCFLRCPPP